MLLLLLLPLPRVICLRLAAMLAALGCRLSLGLNFFTIIIIIMFLSLSFLSFSPSLLLSLSLSLSLSLCVLFSFFGREAGRQAALRLRDTLSYVGFRADLCWVPKPEPPFFVFASANFLRLQGRLLTLQSPIAKETSVVRGTIKAKLRGEGLGRR